MLNENIRKHYETAKLSVWKLYMPRNSCQPIEQFGIDFLLIHQMFSYGCVVYMNGKMKQRAIKATTRGLWSSSSPSLKTLRHWSNAITNLCMIVIFFPMHSVIGLMILLQWHTAYKHGEDELRRPLWWP